MKLCSFKLASGKRRVGLVLSGNVLLDVTAGGVISMRHILDQDNLHERLAILKEGDFPRYAWDEVQLLSPIERHEIWAVGVTYLRSKAARMEESDFSATAYDKVYDAVRPELFFKAMPEKVVGSGSQVGIRRDAKWSVPEPELALVLNSHGKIVGYTIGNDMSSRDLEGENLLYLPQAKIYDRSCAIGPCIRVGVDESEARTWKIQIEIERDGKKVFNGETSVDQIKRSFTELVEYLFRSQTFPHGVVLLTGTGIVPPDDFTLQSEDCVRIAISGIGVLENSVMVV